MLGRAEVAMNGSAKLRNEVEQLRREIQHQTRSTPNPSQKTRITDLTPDKSPLINHVKISGQSPQTEKLNITPDTAWAIVALPTGGYAPLPLY